MKWFLRLLGICLHTHVSRPMNNRQYCFDCSQSRVVILWPEIKFGRWKHQEPRNRPEALMR